MFNHWGNVRDTNEDIKVGDMVRVNLGVPFGGGYLGKVTAIEDDGGTYIVAFETADGAFGYDRDDIHKIHEA